MKWPNKGKKIFLSPRKHKETIFHLALFKDTAKHATKAIRSALPSKGSWNKRTLEKQGTFLKTSLAKAHVPKKHMRIIKDKTLS